MGENPNLEMIYFMGMGFCYLMANKYEGEFMNGELTGEGRLINEHGSICEGQFKNGVLHGKGKVTFGAGEEEDDTMLEVSRKVNSMVRDITYSDGAKYEGEFKNGKFDGLGITTSVEGDKSHNSFLDTQMVME